MGGGNSKKYQNITCHACTATASIKLFQNGTYVPACDNCAINATKTAQPKSFHPTSFVDMISYVDKPNNTKEAVENFLKGDVIELIGPRKNINKKPSHPQTSTRPARFLVPTASPVLEQKVAAQETKSTGGYQPQFLVPGATPVQEVGRAAAGATTAAYEEYQQPYEEPLSWRPQQKQEQYPQPRQPLQENLGSLSIGQRHCRYNRCPCSHFENDAHKPTTCTECSHGEMYHRSKAEAPLARISVPGSGLCAHCNLNITGGQFSGWYKEPKQGGVVHDECWQLYRESNAPKCQQCNVIILKNCQGFTGRYSKVSFGNGPKVKVHKECLAVYLECQRGDEYRE